MKDSILEDDSVGAFNRKQQLFFRYSFLVLVDLTVLNLLDQYWDLVFIENFTISLFTAILLQILLALTLRIEHHIAESFRKKPGISAKILRGLSTWAVLFGSKLVILEAINRAFGDRVLFGGPMHGVLAFIAVVVIIIVAEQIFFRIYRSLA